MHDKTLVEAWKLLFQSLLPPEIKNWQLAEIILAHFNVPVLGEELAKNVLFTTVLWVDYPDKTITTYIVRKAEDFLTELIPELPDESHQDLIERLARRLKH